MKRFATSMTTKLMMRAAIALVVASAGATWCLATPTTDISSAGPLIHIWIGNDLSCQAQHMFDTPNDEFYPAGADAGNSAPGDYGTFVAMDGMLYAPDIYGHDSTAAFSIGSFTPFDPVSQNVSGSGAIADPFKVVTIVNVGDTQLQIQQTDSYVVGDEFFTTEIMLINNGTDTASGVVYRAFDAFLGGFDLGYGFSKALSDPSRTEVACSVNPNNSPPGKIEALIPITGGNNYVQGYYDGIWSLVASQAPFPDFVDGTFEDNGAGISWNFSIPAGSSKTVAHTTLISSPAGLQPLVTSKTADSPTSPAGTQNGYTITINNSNATAVTLSSITDTLPPGFVYVAGSTTLATTNDPTIAGQMLTWSGSLSVPAHGSITLHFAVTVAATPGVYYNEAGGSAAQGYNVVGTGQTAPITVTSTVTRLAVSPATGTYGGFTTLFATLSSGNNPIVGATINFTANGISAGTGVTNTAGVAKSSAVLLVGSAYHAGTFGPATGTGAEASFAGNGSYAASYGNNTLTVNKAPLTVSADNKTKLYGTPNPMLTAVYAGFVNNEGDSHAPGATSGVTGMPTLSTTATQSSPVGQYPITVSLNTLNGGTNYQITTNPGTLTVYLGGIVCLDACTIGASTAVIDSYNSSMGPYSQNNQSNDALLLSNGTITLQGADVHGDLNTAGKVILQANSLVTGDLFYGTTTSVAGSAVVQGSTVQQSAALISAPIPGACGSYTKAPGAGNQWITGAYTYDPVKGNLTVSGGGMATMAAGNYCFNNVTVSGGSTLAFSGAVTLNVNGKFTDSGGSLQNPSLIPLNLQVSSSYTGSNGVTVSGTSTTYMTIYAPGTNVTISGGGPLFGALVGKTLTVSGNSFVHEDLALPDVWGVFGP